MRKRDHFARARRHIAAARQSRQSGYLADGGESLWGAVCQAIKGLADDGRAHRHGKRARIGKHKGVLFAYKEWRQISDADMRAFTRSALGLHGDFYDPTFDTVETLGHMRQAEELAQKMIRIGEQE